MPSYVVVGASRGLGYAFLEHLSKDPGNIIIGTARKPTLVNERVKQDGLKNVSVIEADILDRASLRTAAAETGKLTDGSVDYLILNAAFSSDTGDNRFLDEFEDNPDALQRELDLSWKTNVVGFVDAINAFLPLVKKGSVKKVLAISSGMADIDLISKYELWEAAPYSISKAALNAAIAKYAARYGKDGILFLSISPGFVDTGHPVPEGSEIPLKFMKYAPHFTGQITPTESVEKCLGVLERSSVGNGDGGAFISHLGTKQWL